MKQIIATLAGMLTLLGTLTATAQEGLIESVANGCETELTEFCSNVTPGEGRVLACIYAHGDKLSGQCEYALYDAAAQLERFVGALTLVVNECKDDLLNMCGNVEMGEGRVAQCLLDNKADLQPRCAAAVDVTGMAVE